MEELEKVILRIGELRKEKGYSQEVMAMELGISPSAYNKVERMESKLSLERFLEIRKILKKDFSDFFDIKTERIFNQNISDQAFGNVEHFYQENKEVYEKLIYAKDEQIAFLKKLLEDK